MIRRRRSKPLATVCKLGQPLTGNLQDYDGLLGQAGERHLVVLGESSHGTREFLQFRLDITRRLIEEKGFEAIAIEGDGTSALHLNGFVGALDRDAGRDADSGQCRIPGWAGGNDVMGAFIKWLQQHSLTSTRAVGFYGLDTHYFYRSTCTALKRLNPDRPDEARAAAWLAGRLARFGGRQWFSPPEALKPEVREPLVAALLQAQKEHCRDLQCRAHKALGGSFQAELCQRSLTGARDFYQTLIISPLQFWNLHEAQMSDGIEALQAHLRSEGGRGKVVAWTHNIHTGDAGATQLGWRGDVRSLGQLCRARTGHWDCLLLGLTAHGGQASMTDEWGGSPSVRRIQPAVEGSVEKLLFRSGLGRFYLPLGGAEAAPLREVMLQRALGAVFTGEPGRPWHYIHGSIARQFDALIHIDETTALNRL